MNEMIGEMLGDSLGEKQGQRYKIQSLLGKQSGRRTFLAQDRQTQQPVVVKLVLFSPDFDWQDLKLFEREAETLQSLDHPAIPKYLDSFEVEMDWGRGFALVQTYIEARSLQEWVSAGRTFSEKDLCAIAQALLKILNYLHHRNPPVIHRDLKPSNILFEPETNQLYLVDFGSVKTAQSSGTMTIVGTYGYMPPEQFGGRAQPASDLYSLGATLIYLSTGKHPADLTSDNFQDNIQIAFEAYSNLSPFLTRWIRQLTYSDLSKRTSSARQALQQLIRPQPVKEVGSVRQHSINISRTPSSALIKSDLNDFKVISTTQTLEIRCWAYRISTNFTKIKLFKFFDRKLSVIELSTIAVLFSVALFTIILFSTGTLILALLLAIIVFGLGFPVLSSFNFGESVEARLRLARSSNGKLILSLFTLPSTAENVDINLSDNKAHCRDMQLKSLDVLGPDATSGGRISFCISPQNQPGRDRIQISGSRQELEWLKAHISNWGGVPMD